MITCKLGDKTYTVDFIAGRANLAAKVEDSNFSHVLASNQSNEFCQNHLQSLADGFA